MDLITNLVHTFENVSDSMDADLALKSASSGSQGDFYADLNALYAYYQDMTKLYHEIDSHGSKLGSSATETNMVVDDLLDTIGVDLSSITGVSDSINATNANAVGGSNSLAQGVKAIKGAVAQHLQALSEVYLKYIDADQSGAAELNAAANSGVSTATFTPKTTVARTGSSTTAKKKADDSAPISGNVTSLGPS